MSLVPVYFPRFLFLFLLSISHSVLAVSNFYTSGPASSYGPISHGQGYHNNSINPATGAFDRQRMRSEQLIMGTFSLGAGLEYGGVDELFERIDEVAKGMKPSEPDDGGDNNGGGDNGGGDDGGISIGDIIDLDDPDLQRMLQAAKKEAISLGAVVALVATEGYAHVYLGSSFNFIINDDFLGGTLGANFHSSMASSIIGFSEPINFDYEQALEELKEAYQLKEGDETTTFDLSGGLSITVNPNTRKIKVQFQNDSTLISRAAKIIEFGVSYSRPLAHWQYGELFLGVKPKLNWIGLTQIATRIGDITDSESLFNDIKNVDFEYDSKLGVDLGMLWVAPNYSLGATIVNSTEPNFYYPNIDTFAYSNTDIIKKIDDGRVFELERQYKVEASVYTQNRRWFAGVAADLNATPDPLHQQNQWLTVSASYHPDYWWFSNVRTGVKQNIVGSELAYLNLGATFLKYLNLDLSSTLLLTEISDIKLPRGVGASLGVNFAF